MTTDQSQFGISKFVSCLSTSWPKAGYNYSTLTFILFLLINTFFVMEHCIYRVSNVLLGKRNFETPCKQTKCDKETVCGFMRCVFPPAKKNSALLDENEVGLSLCFLHG